MAEVIAEDAINYIESIVYVTADPVCNKHISRGSSCKKRAKIRTLYALTCEIQVLFIV